MSRSVLVAAVSAAALFVSAPAAVAADLPAYEPAPAAVVPSASNWTGAYVGVQGGYSSARGHNKGAPDTKPKGGVVGGYAGYDYQFDGSPVVVGVDTDLNYNSNSDKRAGVKNELNWSGATRAKVGYAMDRAMVYGAGGVAYGGHEVRAAGAGSDKTAVGWTVGGGVEGLLADNVTARAEYRYTDYGTDKFGTGAGQVKSNLTENRVTAGVAYKFGGF